MMPSGMRPCIKASWFCSQAIIPEARPAHEHVSYCAARDGSRQPWHSDAYPPNADLRGALIAEQRGQFGPYFLHHFSCAASEVFSAPGFPVDAFQVIG